MTQDLPAGPWYPNGCRGARGREWRRARASMVKHRNDGRKHTIQPSSPSSPSTSTNAPLLYVERDWLPLQSCHAWLQWSARCNPGCAAWSYWASEAAGFVRLNTQEVRRSESKPSPPSLSLKDITLSRENLSIEAAPPIYVALKELLAS
ncbi:hypothetical protein CSUB01_03921 [Colletotrichum sublineola]|uniref:Uncharacterized protein n=1 Tax=Colletotrichum sublineola TaxID=1173701 RepID=A0A066X8Y7_COLSU|nr:hypothetical protein CSUB01_03921 [Colletotrichum sublineola]